MTEELKKLFKEGLYEYPLSTVFIENLFMSLWLAIGTILCGAFLPMVGWIYLVFGLVMVLFVMRIFVCKSCYYHGKQCHTGWGKLSALYCKQGELAHFGCGVGGVLPPLFYGSMTLLPIILGIISIVQTFSWFYLCVLLIFVFVSVFSSYVLRKKACAVCKMKTICPGSAVK